MSAKAKDVLWEVTNHMFNQYFADFGEKKEPGGFFGGFLVFWSICSLSEEGQDPQWRSVWHQEWLVLLVVL